MLTKIDHKNMGTSNLGWLNSIFHFSFADYYNQSNLNFGVLRVLNDDLIQPNNGFDLHPHRNMEIITYVIDGVLTHQDSIGNIGTLNRGDVQYMSAGTGVFHSEHNYGKDILRLLQIWIIPNAFVLKPKYEEYHFDWSLRKNKLFKIASNSGKEAPIKINQDINIYVLELDKNHKINFPVANNRQAYLVQVEGKSIINHNILNEKDALKIIEEDITILAQEASHFIIIEMQKEE